MRLRYVNIKTKGCEGWLNLFVGEHCIAMVSDPALADQVRAQVDLMDDLAKRLHYPGCWDTAAYPDLGSALQELAECSACKPAPSGDKLPGVSAARQRRIRHAVIDCEGQFPKQLLGSGVMFFDGERITLEEFNQAKDSMGVRYW